jgi:hypothetical protein
VTQNVTSCIPLLRVGTIIRKATPSWRVSCKSPKYRHKTSISGMAGVERFIQMACKSLIQLG